MSEATAAAAATDEESAVAPDGVLPSQALSEAIAADWVSSGDYRIRPEAIQPASIDLRLGDHAWALRCSFLPDVDSTVEEKIEGLAFQKVDLRDGAVLERDRLERVLEGERVVGDAQLGGDFLGLGRSDAVDIGERDFDALIGRDIYTRDTCHGL